MEPLAFTTDGGSTYVVTFREDGAGIDVVRISDHPIRGRARDRDTSFAARYTSVEFVAGPRGIQVRFANAQDPTGNFLTSPVTRMVQVGT